MVEPSPTVILWSEADINGSFVSSTLNVPRTLLMPSGVVSVSVILLVWTVLPVVVDITPLSFSSKSSGWSVDADVVLPTGSEVKLYVAVLSIFSTMSSIGSCFKYASLNESARREAPITVSSI